jgi:uncharacterized protein (DUF4415 family)
MSANAKSIRHQKARLPTLNDVAAGRISLDDYEIAHGEDIPELTDEDMRNALPISEVPLLQEFYERMRGERGPQKAPVKERVGLRLDAEIVEHFRSTGSGWQSRINDILKTHIAAQGKQK